MRRFNSYGPINTNIHYYAPRKDLIAKSFTQLVGENPSEGGHYITVWAPRQTGKTWVMQEILFQLKENPRFDVLKINLEILKDKEDTGEIINVMARKIGEGLGKKISGINNQDQFQEIFKKDVLDKPLILILDEFDALSEKAINTIVSAFRNIHISRTDEKDKSSEQKTYLLHAVALIGVRSVLGIENEKGSPLNIQRSIHISNLSFEEVKGMFEWYEQESGQEIEPAVIEKLYQETAGQPGLTCWLGELLTEGAVYHFNLFSYLNEFLREKGGCVVPEFPTGNGKIDLLIKYKGKLYGIELKSYKDQAGFKMALKQAALYGKRLELGEIFLSVFVEYIDEKKRAKYEVDYLDEEMGVMVKPVFIATGN